MRVGKGCGGSGVIQWIKSFSSDTDHTEINPLQLSIQGMHMRGIYGMYAGYVCMFCMFGMYV